MTQTSDKSSRQLSRQSRPDWDSMLLQILYALPGRSQDPRTTHSAVIVSPDHSIVSTGYNSLPRGISARDPARFVKPRKHFFFEHAERNAIFQAARLGHATLGCTLYTQSMPCCECARAIIQAGLTELVLHANHPGNQKERLAQEPHCFSRTMLDEAGLRVRFLEGKVRNPVLLFDGEPLSDLFEKNINKDINAD